MVKRRSKRIDVTERGEKSYKSFPIVSDKHAENRLSKVVEIVPKTRNQEKALKFLKEKQVVVLRNASGTGKTYLACTHAANEYLRGKCKRIVLIRPYEMVGRSIGLRPGTTEEKLRPLMLSMLQHLEKVFGKAELEAKIACGNVVMEALEDCRGRSYADSILILDEAANVDSHAMKAIVTRLEESSRLFICGDGQQKDTKSDSGIDVLCDVIQKVRDSKPTYLNENDLRCAFENFGVVNFTTDDVVRSGFTSLMVKVIDKEWRN